jgi:putative cardiolipin synthase
MRSITFILIFLLWILQAFADEGRILSSGAESDVLREALILNEQKEIRLSTYIFDVDERTKRVLGLLVNKAKSGVKVYLSIDGHPGSITKIKNHPILAALEDAGVDVRLYNPTVRSAITINNRNHMKGLFGSEYMIHGDRNEGEKYFDRTKKVVSIDVLIKGDAVKVANEHFDEVYKHGRHKTKLSLSMSKKAFEQAKADLAVWAEEAKTIKVPRVPLDKGNFPIGKVKYVGDVPEGIFGKSATGLHSETIEMINRATSTLEFTNPYVLLTPEAKTALEQAIKRGVKITINSNSSRTTNIPMLGMAWEHHRFELLDMGININEFKDGYFLHAKTIVRDGEEVYIGSYNLDPRSQNTNLENGSFIENKQFAERMSAYNRRIVAKLTTKVEKEVPLKMTAKEKASSCVRKNFRKYLSKSMHSLL